MPSIKKYPKSGEILPRNDRSENKPRPINVEFFNRNIYQIGWFPKAEKYFKEMINYYNNVIETKIAANQNAVSSIIDLQTQFLNFLAKRSENVAKISSPPHLPPFPPPHPLPHLPLPSLSPSLIIHKTFFYF